MIPALHLVLSLTLLPASVPAASQEFQPDEVLRPPGGPEIALFRSAPPGVVTLRVSVPLVEAPEEAGVGQLIRRDAMARMEALADRIGARVQVQRTAAALVYQVSGASADLDFLTWILREGLEPPRASAFDDVRRLQRVEVEQRLETPEGALALRLRERLSPGSGGLQGTPGSLDRMDHSRLTAAWARSHRRSDLRLVVVGQVPTPFVLAAVGDLGLPPDSPLPELPPPPDIGPPPTNPEVLRHWVAEARTLVERRVADPVALVTTRLLGDLLRQDPGDYDIGAELWEVRGESVLVLSGAAFPRSQQAMRARLAGLLAEAPGHATQERVRLLARELGLEIRLTGRTPWGLAELVGQAWEAGRGPEGVEQLLEGLERVEAEEVRALLEALAARDPVREEIRP